MLMAHEWECAQRDRNKLINGMLFQTLIIEEKFYNNHFVVYPRYYTRTLILRGDKIIQILLIAILTFPLFCKKRRLNKIFLFSHPLQYLLTAYTQLPLYSSFFLSLSPLANPGDTSRPRGWSLALGAIGAMINRAITAEK